jgi:hypothetical protein
MRVLFAGVLFAFAALPAHAITALDLSDPASVVEHLRVSPGLVARRGEFARDIVAARRRVAAFAARFGWQDDLRVRTIDSVEIFDSQQALWARLCAIDGVAVTPPPPMSGFTATVEKRILVAADPEEYRRVAPAYAGGDPDSWVRVLAHEMIHELHRRILHGDDDAMGPRWFYEGFAVFGSGQSFDRGLVYRSAWEALAGAHDTKSPGAYRRFVAVTRYFAARIALPEIVAQAGKPGFEAWLSARAPR